MAVSTLLIIIAILAVAIIILFILPGLFNNTKKLLYFDKNKGYSDGMNVRNSFFYDAANGTQEADQIPLH